MFSPDELTLLKAVLTVPTCWQPELREQAAALVERAEKEQLTLLKGGV